MTETVEVLRRQHGLHLSNSTYTTVCLEAIDRAMNGSPAHLRIRAVTHHGQERYRLIAVLASLCNVGG
jgi:hypothetical protein